MASEARGDERKSGRGARALATEASGCSMRALGALQEACFEPESL